ncbi:hypothetical protein AAFC00_005476 [Neodothiora populina]|uniref:Uncharacterized protein n=1 Tax=Neodothiora populina TaxID=2781224 RepID=A0ABR3PL13_9PEZI
MASRLSQRLPLGIAPRSIQHLQAQQRLQHNPLISTLIRHASSSSIKPPRKPIVLEKPAKFNPPSHGSRLPTSRRRGASAAALPTYGRSENEKQQSEKRRYPHMMPPEGTFLHWFLTNKSIHVWITMSILTSLAFFTFLTNFTTSTPYADQLPPNNFFFSHPFAFITQYFRVYKLHTEYVSMQTAEHRRHKVEDVRKRSEYRKAHGLDEGEGLGGWSVKSDDEVMGPGMKEGGPDFAGAFGGAVPAGPVGAEVVGAEGVDSQDAARAVAGERRPPPRKWLGIW